MDVRVTRGPTTNDMVTEATGRTGGKTFLTGIAEPKITDSPPIKGTDRDHTAFAVDTYRVVAVVD